MTPAHISLHYDKTLVSTAETQPATEQNSKQPDSDPNSSSESDSNPDPATDERDDHRPEPTVLIRTVSPHGGVVYHKIAETENETDDNRPLCGADGEFIPVPLADARKRTSGLCKHCTTAQNGEVDQRPCPHCDELIPVTHWPQHVRTCDGSHQHTCDEQAQQEGKNSAGGRS